MTTFYWLDRISIFIVLNRKSNFFLRIVEALKLQLFNVLICLTNFIDPTT